MKFQFLIMTIVTSRAAIDVILIYSRLESSDHQGQSGFIEELHILRGSSFNSKQLNAPVKETKVARLLVEGEVLDV